MTSGSGLGIDPTLLDRAMLATSTSFTIADALQDDLPLVWVNAAFTATTGYSFDEAVGRNCRFLQGPGTSRDALAQIRSAVAGQRPVTVTLLNYRKDGTPFWNELAIAPIRDADGQVTHFVGVQADVTARVEVQRARDDALVQAEVSAGRLTLLADFTARLAGSLEADEIVSQLVDVLVPRMASWVVVHLYDDGERAVRSTAKHERMDSDPAVAELLRDLDRAIAENLPNSLPAARVLRGEIPSALITDVAAHPRAAGLYDDDRSGIARRLGISSMLVVPLRTRSRVVGSISVVGDGSRRPFGQADLDLALELAGRAGLMLENSMLYERERAAAGTLQRSLMPRVPTLPGLTVAAEYLTATDEAAVGGDWYDVFALESGAVGITVGDAMGHNFDSAAAMGKLSTMLRSYAWTGAEPGRVLDAVDGLLAGTGLEYLATCCYGTIRRVDSGARFAYSSAGHPAPVLRDPDGRTRLLDDGRGAMLGVAKLRPGGPARPNAEVDLPRGSTLIFFTDGLTDSVGPDLDVSEAMQRVARIVAEQPVRAEPRDIVATLVKQSDGGRIDDIAVIAVRID